VSSFKFLLLICSRSILTTNLFSLYKYFSRVVLLLISALILIYPIFLHKSFHASTILPLTIEFTFPKFFVNLLIEQSRIYLLDYGLFYCILFFDLPFIITLYFFTIKFIKSIFIKLTVTFY